MPRLTAAPSLIPIQRRPFRSVILDHEFRALETIQLLLENVTGITARGRNGEKITIHLAILEKILEIAQISCSDGSEPETSRKIHETFSLNIERKVSRRCELA